MTANNLANMDRRTQQHQERRLNGSRSSRTNNNAHNNNNHNNAARNADDHGLSFPLKLHAMLEDAESKGFANIVSWQAGDKSFKVIDVNKFGSDIMPMYFNQTKFKSFQRQLNIYGYRRIQHGPLKGGYVHKSFIRHRPELSSNITRRSNHHASTKAAAASAVAAKVMEMVTVQGNQVRVAPDADPTQLEEVFEEIDYEPINNLAQSVDFGSCNLQAVLDRIFVAEPGNADIENGQGKKKHHRSRPSLLLPQAVSSNAQAMQQMDGTVVNVNQPGNQEEADMEALFDMLADNGASPPNEDEGDSGSAAAAQHSSSESSTSEHDEQESEEQLSERIFPLKLHKMLENAPRDGIDHIVSWVSGGFKVHDSKLFTEQVMPMWFDQTKYESFRRQLNLYNFARISRGPQRGVYSHPSFVPGRRDLLSNVTRKINGEVQAPKQSNRALKAPPAFEPQQPAGGYPQHHPQPPAHYAEYPEPPHYRHAVQHPPPPPYPHEPYGPGSNDEAMMSYY
ncbi:HSF-type DNA-binding protein [Nitzschia inconspicua]|uniref:HSF-type DNA-binding protein n=1 Tax=Nitzschia inconspicua TaxID=303405 RepID=A0A9K3LKH6_9STRA|nr:HSF-type DNA-binding protein [Nitzschia inconspicua]